MDTTSEYGTATSSRASSKGLMPRPVAKEEVRNEKAEAESDFQDSDVERLFFGDDDQAALAEAASTVPSRHRGASAKSESSGSSRSLSTAVSAPALTAKNEVIDDDDVDLQRVLSPLGLEGRLLAGHAFATLSGQIHPFSS